MGCVTIGNGAGNITIDCNGKAGGYNITYDQGGTITQFGVTLGTLVRNITIKNCLFIEGNSTTTTANTRGILVNTGGNLTIYNNTFYINASVNTHHAITMTGAFNTYNISSNTMNLYNRGGCCVALASTPTKGTIEYNTCTQGAAVAFDATGAATITVINNNTVWGFGSQAGYRCNAAATTTNVTNNLFNNTAGLILSNAGCTTHVFNSNIFNGGTMAFTTCTAGTNIFTNNNNTLTSPVPAVTFTEGPACNGLTVQNNTFYSTAAAGSWTFNGANNTVTGNNITVASGTVLTMSNAIVSNNTFSYNLIYGGTITAATCGVATRNNQFTYNNFTSAFTQSATCSNLTITNNYFNGGGSVTLAGQGNNFSSNWVNCAGTNTANSLVIGSVNNTVIDSNNICGLSTFQGLTLNGPSYGTLNVTNNNISAINAASVVWAGSCTSNCNLINNNINSTGSGGNGGITSSTSINYTIKNNIVKIYGSCNAALYTSGTHVGTIIDSNNLTCANDSNKACFPLFVTSTTTGVIVLNNNFFSGTGNITFTQTGANMTLKYNNSFVDMTWNSSFGGLKIQSPNLYNLTITSPVLNMSNNSAFFNASMFSNAINSSTNITFFQINTSYTNPTPLNNNNRCGTTCQTITAYPTSPFIIKVTDWGSGGIGNTYSLGENPNCTAPASGNWNIFCQDNCTFNSQHVIANGNVTTSGTGQIVFNNGGKWSFGGTNQYVWLNPTCNININSGGGFF